MIDYEISPGPVTIDEILIRIILTPEHVKDGKIISSAIPTKQLQTNGCSLTRKPHANKEILSKVVDTLSKGANSFYALALISYKILQSFKYEDGNQVLYVKPAPTEENIAHANMFFVNKVNFKKSEWKMIREQIIKNFTNLQNIDEVFVAR